LIILLLPETARSIVGNGSERVSGLRRALLQYPFRRPEEAAVLSCPSAKSADAALTSGEEMGRRRDFKFPNPLASLKLLWAKDSALITLIFGVFYMNLSSLQASTSTLFVKIHGISGIELGLVYLPSGIGSVIGAYYAGN